MELIEDEIIGKYGDKNVDIVIEISYLHMNMNGPAFHVDITYSKESRTLYNSAKKKFCIQIKFCSAKNLLYLCRCI